MYKATQYQKNIIFQHLAAEHPQTLNLIYIFRIDNLNLSLQELASAWNKIMDQFVCLRYYFKNIETEEPSLLIYDNASSHYLIKKETPDVITNEILDNWIISLSNVQFSLNIPPLCQLNLLKGKGNRIYLGFVFHHILADSQATGKILESFCKVCEGNHLSLDKEKQLNDMVKSNLFLSAQSSNILNKARNYYASYLKGQSLSQSLPWRCEGNQFIAKRIFKEFDHRLQKSVKNGSLNLNKSVFVLMISTFCYLLARWKLSDKLIIGYPIRAKNIESNGFYVNTLPLKVNISKTQTFDSLTEIIEQDHFNNLKYDTFPLSEIMDVVRAEGNKQPFNVIFSSTKFFTGYEIANSKLEPVNLKNIYAQSDLIFYIDTSCKNWQMCIEYKSTLLTDGIARSFLDDYVKLLSAVIKNSSAPLGLIYESIKENYSPTLFPLIKNSTFSTFLEIFHNTVITLQNYIAIEHGTTCISYGELYSKSLKISNFLIQKGLNKGDKVIIHLKKTPFYLETIIALLMCNAVFIPVDVSQPIERLKLIIEDSKPKFIITDKAFKYDFFKQVIYQEEVIEGISEAYKSSWNIDRYLWDVNPEDPVYIIYTSGSTGTPKGVCIKQKGLANLALEQGKIIGMSPQETVLLFAAISFDASISEWSTTFAYGGKLIIPKIEQKFLLPELTNIINKHHVSIVTLPPIVLSSINPAELKSLNTVISAGESMSEYVKRLWSNEVNLFNAYGPTESTVCSTMCRVTENAPINKIGEPISGIGAYIAHPQKKFQCSIGAIGEITIYGEGVALGYTNNALENKHFYSVIISSKPYRFYQTGDIGYCDENNCFYYLGRNDDQIKINAHRIEIGEIKAVIESIKGVFSTHIAFMEKEPNNLYAFIYTDKNFDFNNLKRQVVQKLPHYMHPKHYIISHKPFPITINGKVEEKILFERTRDTSSFDKTATPYSGKNIKYDNLTNTIIQLWEQILNEKIFNLEDDFFDYGGDSLKATRLFLEVQKKFGIKIAPKQFLNNPTISCLISLLKLENNKEIKSQWENDLKNLTTKSYEHSLQETKKETYLVTGATGHVGKYLVKELLDDEACEVWCIVRGDNDHVARTRLCLMLLELGIDQSKLKNLQVFAGDMLLPDFGLSKDIINLLVGNVTEIIHAAAEVHHLLSYNNLRKSNVLSTKLLLTLMEEGCNKRFHYISALSANNQPENEILEKFDDSNLCSISGGYNLTKWVSEKILERYHKLGYPIFIYRLPTIWGPYNKLAFSWKKDHQSLILASCIQLGIAPYMDRSVAIVPVDWAASNIKKLILNSKVNKVIIPVYILLPYIPIKWNKFLQTLNQHNINIKEVPIEVWKNSLSTIGPENYLYPLLGLYTGNDSIQDSTIKLSNDTLQSILSKCDPIYGIEDYLIRTINFINNSFD